jgi:EAL domain-containing protein (putative c-di-GMP-specific phosphodiesterase class I)
VSLGRWILEQACAQAREWELALNGAQPFFVSVNVSIRQLHEQDFPQVVAGVLARTVLEHQSLVLEITESLLAVDPEAIIRQLLMLKQLRPADRHRRLRHRLLGALATTAAPDRLPEDRQVPY